MTDAKMIEAVVSAVLAELQKGGAGAVPPSAPSQVAQSGKSLPDITSPEMRGEPLLKAEDEEGLRRMMSRTSARIGVGRAGTRLKTQTLLTLRADHAAARDAVFLDVDQGMLDRLGLFTITTKCADRNQHLTRPDLGRDFPPESLEELKKRCTPGADVVIYAADGLSSRALEANLPDLLPPLMEGLKSRGISVGTPFFVKYGRVASMEHIAQALGCKVVCVLIGERPGLGSAESMSAYLAYNARVGMPEADRTVVSNIYSGGIAAVEAGAYLAELIARILEQKVSGVNLKK